MNFRPKTRKAERKIDLTPMIDCVFQLLLFFLVASHFNEEARMSTEGELNANLPEAASALPLTAKPREMFVNIDQQGRFVVAGQVLNERQLAGLLRRAEVNNPGNQSVVIRGDERADWKYVARVMSLCNQASIHDYRVAVIPPEAATEGE